MGYIVFGHQVCINFCFLTFRLAHLNSTHRQHLLPQVVLVFPDAAVPPSNRLVLADHNVFGNLVEKSEVMGHDDDTT